MAPVFVSTVASIIDKVIPDPAAAAAAKLQVLELEQRGQLAPMFESVKVIVAEAQAGGVTARWRPIVMLTFTSLIVARWLGFSAPGITESEIMKLWNIVEFGLGGYVVGRSAEKVVSVAAQAYVNGKTGGTQLPLQGD